MLHTIEIDDSTGTGKSLIALLRDLAKTNKGIRIEETEEDGELFSAMTASISSGIASREEADKVLRELRGK